MYTHHTKCRACGNDKLKLVFDLGTQSLANDFRKPGEPRHGLYPLRVLFCDRCTLAQLGEVVAPEILYANYPYTTSRSRMMAEHFNSVLKDIEITLNIANETLGLTSIMEIASNDGFFLQTAKESRFGSVTGVEPAENLAAIANANGIPTHCDFFNTATAEKLAGNSEFKFPDVIVARHVLAHVDDWHDFILGLYRVSHPETLVFIEVPCVADMLQNNSFDQIYSEHLSYVTVKSVEAALEFTGWRIQSVAKYPIHGGSVGIFLRRRDSAIKATMPYSEDPITSHDWIDFRNRSTTIISDLSEFIHDKCAHGKTIAGFGASAKSSVWINMLGLTKREIGFICDCTEQKQWKLSPGTDIPIVGESELLRLQPDFCIIFAWNFAIEIIANNQEYLKAGGKFVVPVPELKVIDS